MGRKSDAIKLYQSRKADVVAGRKLPELRNSKVVTLSELIDDVLEFVAHHKDNRSYESKGEIVRKALGSKPAADLTPQELERWLRIRCQTPATANRYKAFISLCYREGVRNGKVSVNPARLVRQRKEGPGRLRFLNREEYDRLHKVVAARFPEHLAEFVVSIHTGMRLSEQYSCMWSQVDLERRTIELTKTRTAQLERCISMLTLSRRLGRSNDLYKRHPIRCFRARDHRGDSTPALGSNRPWKRQRLRATFGIQTGTHFAYG